MVLNVSVPAPNFPLSSPISTTTAQDDVIKNDDVTSETSEVYWQVSGLLLVAVAGVTGNFLACMAVYVERKLHSVANYFLVSLAATDLCVCLVIMPCCILQEFLGYWPLGLALCNVWQLMDVALCTSSIMHMCTISLDRYMTLSRPLARRQGRFARSLPLRISTVWIASLAIASPTIYLGVHRPLDILGPDRKCVVTNPYFLIYGSLAAFFCPLIVMLVTHSLTIHLLRKQGQRASKHGDDGGLRRIVVKRQKTRQEPNPSMRLSALRNEEVNVELLEKESQQNVYHLEMQLDDKLIEIQQQQLKLQQPNRVVDFENPTVPQKNKESLGQLISITPGFNQKTNRDNLSNSVVQSSGFGTLEVENNPRTPSIRISVSDTDNIEYDIELVNMQATGREYVAKFLSNADLETKYCSKMSYFDRETEICPKLPSGGVIGCNPSNSSQPNVHRNTPSCSSCHLVYYMTGSSDENLQADSARSRDTSTEGSALESERRVENSSQTIAKTSEELPASIHPPSQCLCGRRINLARTEADDTVCQTKSSNQKCVFCSTDSRHAAKKAHLINTCNHLSDKNCESLVDDSHVENSSNKDYLYSPNRKYCRKCGEVCIEKRENYQNSTSKYLRDTGQEFKEVDLHIICSRETRLKRNGNNNGYCGYSSCCSCGVNANYNYPEGHYSSQRRNGSLGVCKSTMDVSDSNSDIDSTLKSPAGSCNVEDKLICHTCRQGITKLAHNACQKNGTPAPETPSTPSNNSNCDSLLNVKTHNDKASSTVVKSQSTNPTTVKGCTSDKNKIFFPAISRTFTKNSNSTTATSQTSTKNSNRTTARSISTTSSASRLNSKNEAVAQMRNVKTEQKAVRVLSTMFASFVACWVLFFTLNLVLGACPACHINHLVMEFALWLGYVSSMVNPIIYTAFNRTFRTAIISLLTCRVCRVKSRRQGNSRMSQSWRK